MNNRSGKAKSIKVQLVDMGWTEVSRGVYVGKGPSAASSKPSGRVTHDEAHWDEVFRKAREEDDASSDGAIEIP